MLAISLFVFFYLDDIAGFGASKFLERVLYENGRACFIKDETKGFMVLKANPCDKFNIYYLPEKVECFSLGYNEKYDFDDIVYIMNNLLEKPTFATLQLMAYRLFDTERTIDVNLTAQKKRAQSRSFFVAIFTVTIFPNNSLALVFSIISTPYLFKFSPLEITCFINLL